MAQRDHELGGNLTVGLTGDGDRQVDRYQDGGQPAAVLEETRRKALLILFILRPVIIDVQLQIVCERGQPTRARRIDIVEIDGAPYSSQTNTAAARAIRTAGLYRLPNDNNPI